MYLRFKGKGYEIYLRVFKKYQEDTVMINEEELFKVLKVLSVTHDMIGGGFQFEYVMEHWSFKVVSVIDDTIKGTPHNAYVKTDLPVLGRIAKKIGLIVVPMSKKL